MVEAIPSSPLHSPVPTHRLIVFTRYPEPGKTKTRLIPALGADGAAALQKQMTEHTLDTVRHLLQTGISLTVEVRFTGAIAPQMQQWLGSNWHYLSQGEGDLGDRLTRAFSEAFDQGVERAIAIGIDCPEIDATLLNQAFQQLGSCDVVLGPATDGGYYLIGLSRSVSERAPKLFYGIDWGTEHVLAQTLQVADSLGLSVAQLEPLTDVDYPDDLAVWQRTRRTQCPFLSVIIPVLNEESSIEAVLQSLHGTAQPSVQATELATEGMLGPTSDIEIIVVDGGSRDQTVEKAHKFDLFDITVITSAPGRAIQMNAGAAIAQGEALLFLHADTRLPLQFVRLIRNTLAQPDVVAGAFELAIQGDRPGLRWIERGVRWRSRGFQMPYGDQGLFLKADVFRGLGGFAELPIMEDFELVQRLKRRGRVAIAPAAVTTSGRRWEKLGLVRTTLINQLIIIGYLLGVSPKRLMQWYRGNPM